MSENNAVGSAAHTDLSITVSTLESETIKDDEDEDLLAEALVVVVVVSSSSSSSSSSVVSSFRLEICRNEALSFLALPATGSEYDMKRFSSTRSH
jgi:hypothetical protein